MSSTTNHKKRKAGASVGAKEDAKKAKGAKGSDATSTTTTDVESFAVFTLDEIRDQIQALFERVPAIPSNSFYLSPGATGDTEVSTTTATSITVGSNNPLDVLVDQSATREWAAQLQAILEEFNLLVCCVATATYKWGTDRSGAADQNLGLLSGEIASTQDHISSNVSPRLSNVLAPVVDLVIDKTTTTKNNESGEEIKQNHFVQKLGTHGAKHWSYNVLLLFL